MAASTGAQPNHTITRSHRLAPAQGAALIAVDEAWLARTQEDVLEPGLPIVDPHHHIWDRDVGRYLFDEFLQDVTSGHNVTATVFVEGGSMNRNFGPLALRSLGQTQIAAGLAAMSDTGQYGDVRICQGIVAHADLTLGAELIEVIEQHRQVSGGRLRGVRHSTAWHGSPDVVNPRLGTRPGVMRQPQFHDGVRTLASVGLSFDAWVYHPQLPDVIELAAAQPETTIVLNHMGGLVGLGPYEGDHKLALQEWLPSIKKLAELPNVYVKLGGLGMRLGGYRFHERTTPPGSEELASLWRPAIEASIAAFGPSRCMFESNFPVDKGSCSYPVLWNAFKRITSGFSASEKASLYSQTARQVYRLDSVPPL